jgi:hypothetical protein
MIKVFSPGQLEKLTWIQGRKRIHVSVFSPGTNQRGTGIMKTSRVGAVVSLVIFSAGLLMALDSATEEAETSLPPIPGLTIVAPEEVPDGGTFWSVQLTNYAPLPFVPFQNIRVYSLGSNNFAYDDRLISYTAIAEAAEMEKAALMLSAAALGVEMEEEGGGDMAMSSYSSNDVWLEITGVTNDYAYLTLHNPTQGYYWQILSKTDLNLPEWELGEIIDLSSTSVTETNFRPVYTGHQPITFYRAKAAVQVAAVRAGGDVLEPETTNNSGYVGYFYFCRTGSTDSNLVVHYRIGGSATYGVDYTNDPAATTSNMTGSIDLPDHAGICNWGNPGEEEPEWVSIHPLYDGVFELDERVQLTLIPDGGYLIEPGRSTAWVTIRDNETTNMFTTVVTDLFVPVGIDYNPAITSLVVSVESGFDIGEQFYNYAFVRLGTNGSGQLTMTNWSEIPPAALSDEVKLAIVQESAGGFNVGDMFFGTGVDGVVGWVSADGLASNLNWITFTNETHETLLRGGLYHDQTGVFDNDLIAVTGGEAAQGGEVWRISSLTNATRIANVTNNLYPHLEGVITLPIDTNKWGPWAGKIVTGAEAAGDDYGHQLPLIRLIDTNGIVTSLNLGIAPEDFDVIPTNQPLYCTSYPGNRIDKLPSNLFTNYWGDLLITQGDGATQRKLFIVHWNSTNALFEIRSIGYSTAIVFEHVTFAPIDLPTIQGL